MDNAIVIDVAVGVLACVEMRRLPIAGPPLPF